MTQDSRIIDLCEQLGLEQVKFNFNHLGQEAAKEQKSFSDYLESLLQTEIDSKQSRTRQTLAKLAGFPAIKTLDDYDFKFAVGTPKKLIQELSSLSFFERNENMVLV